MRKRLFIPLLIAVAIAAGYLIKEVIAISNPHSWTDGLVAYWSFDGQYATSTSGTADTSGNNNWTAFFGGPTPTAGISGQAMSFDGVNDHASTTNGSIDISAANTFEVWVKVLKNPASSPFFRPILGKSADYTRGLYWVQGGYTVGIYFMADTESGGTWANFDYTPSNDWMHVVGVWTGTRTKIYKNGVLQETSTVNDIWTNNTSNYNMGNSPDGTRFVNIVLDEVRIYSRALSDAEVVQHYKQTKRNVAINPSSSAKFKIATSNTADWSNGLAGYWPFDGQYTTSTAGTRDVSNNGNWGAFKGGVKPVGGISGQSLSFDGVDDYVDAGSGASLITSGSFTVESWIKTSYTVPSNWVTVVGRLVGGSSNRLYQSSSLQDAVFEIYDGVNDPFPRTTTPINDGVWHHIVGVRDVGEDKLKIYMDGVLKQSVTDTITGTITGSNSITIGGEATTRFFNGLIDEVRIYNRALSADEIMEHYLKTRRNLKL